MAIITETIQSLILQPKCGNLKKCFNVELIIKFILVSLDVKEKKVPVEISLWLSNCLLKLDDVYLSIS